MLACCTLGVLSTKMNQSCLRSYFMSNWELWLHLVASFGPTAVTLLSQWSSFPRSYIPRISSEPTVQCFGAYLSVFKADILETRKKFFFSNVTVDTPKIRKKIILRPKEVLITCLDISRIWLYNWVNYSTPPGSSLRSLICKTTVISNYQYCFDTEN